MKNSGMSYKILVLSLALLFGLSQGRLSLKIRHEVKLTKDSGLPLIRKACHGLGHNERACRAIFQERLDHGDAEKVDAPDLALHALGFVKIHSILITNTIKNISAVQSSLAPLFQNSLSDCQDQYDPLDDLIEDAENAIHVNQYDDALKYTNAAIDNIELCDNEFRDTNAEERAENKSEDEIKWSEELKESNDLLKNILIAASNILKSN